MRATLALVSVATCLTFLAPALTGDDDFPISSHPMYATARSDRAELITAEAFDSTGAVVPLTMEVIAATDDPLIAEQRMRNAAASDDADGTCRAIADRAPDSVTRIEIVAVVYDLRAFVSGETTPATRQALAECTTR